MISRMISFSFWFIPIILPSRSQAAPSSFTSGSTGGRLKAALPSRPRRCGVFCRCCFQIQRWKFQSSAFDRMGRKRKRQHLHMNTRSEEHTSELQSLMRISYDVFGLKKKKTTTHTIPNIHNQSLQTQNVVFKNTQLPTKRRYPSLMHTN